MKKLLLLIPVIAILYVHLGSAQESPILESPPILDNVVSTTVTFRWQDLTGVLSYSLEIASDPQFLTMTGPGISVSSSSYTMPEGVLSPNTVYYWRVRGVYESGPGPSSEVWSFRTAGTPSQETVNLSAIVDNLVLTSSLVESQGDYLDHRLDQARAQFDQNHILYGAYYMALFELRVYMLEGSGMLSQADGSELIDYANKILALAFGGANKIPHNLTQAPAEFSLSQNYPNPFNPSTEIEYSIPAAANVTLVVYDMLGKEVARLIDKHQDAGSFIAHWNAAGLSSGVYFYRLTAGEFTAVKRMTLVK